MSLSQPPLGHQISNKKKTVKAPPFYHVNDDEFYHGPAWVIKPRLFPPKENHIEKPGPCHYHIPDRSIYARPGKNTISVGKTIGNRYESIIPISTHLLAHYSPNDHYTSNAQQMAAISITPRRIEHQYNHGYSERLYLPSDRTAHPRAPLLRPLYGPIISRKSSEYHSPGPAAYPMYEFDEDILPRPQTGVTQKHRFSCDRKITHPPFYYPSKSDRHCISSFTIGRRLFSSKQTRQYPTPYYSSFDNKALCSSAIKPGVTLKGRWSPSVYIPS